MRLLLVCLLSVLLASCFFGSTLNLSEKDVAGKPNLVPNGDLENGLYGVFKREALPEHWMLMQSPRDPDAAAWEEGRGCQDSRCLRLKCGQNRLSLISDSFDISPQAAYYNHVWLKTDTDNDEEVECLFLAFDLDGNTVNQFSQRVTPGKSWTKVEFNASFFKKTARFGRIMIVLPPQPERRVWVDGIGSYHALNFTE